MNWRVLRLQAVAILLAFALLAAGTVVTDLRFEDGLSAVALVLFVVYNVLIFAGVHIYLALRGEGGDLPVSARWRFAAVVTAAFALGSLGALASELPSVWGVNPGLPVGVLAAAVIVGYFAYEAREGYRAFREQESL